MYQGVEVAVSVGILVERERMVKETKRTHDQPELQWQLREAENQLIFKATHYIYISTNNLVQQFEHILWARDAG